MTQSQKSPLDDHRPLIESMVAQHHTKSSIVRHLGGLGVETSTDSVRRAVKRWGTIQKDPGGVENPGLHIQGDEAVVTSEFIPDPGDAQAICEKRGLKVEEWDLYAITVNEWEAPMEGGGTKTMQQLKIQLRRKSPLDLPQPARSEGVYKRKQPKLAKPGKKGELVVLVGDQQAPFHDRELHSHFISFLNEVKPERGVLIGDTVDFPDISRHRLDPENTATVQECINAGYEIIRDYVDASPKTHWTKLAGNHDERIRNSIIDQLVRMHGVKRAEVPGRSEHSVHSVAHLLRLDELGVDFLEPNGGYEHMQVNLSPFLAARHGWIARRGSGASALATLQHLGYSVIVGHTHRQSLVHKTTHDINGDLTTLAACETGCMCQIKDGLSYAVNPDWQNGFATATIWPNGRFKIDLATYVNGELLWRDKVYR